MKHHYKIIEGVRWLMNFVKSVVYDDMGMRVFFSMMLILGVGVLIFTGGKGLNPKPSEDRVWLKCSDKIPDGEINKLHIAKRDLVKDRLEGKLSLLFDMKDGAKRFFILNKTDWNIQSIAVLFDIKFMDGGSKSIVLINEDVKTDESIRNVTLDKLLRLVEFNVKDEEMLKYFTDVKAIDMRVVDACGKIRPMKIEIKAKEALKEAGESMNKIKKNINDLFSR